MFSEPTGILFNHISIAMNILSILIIVMLLIRTMYGFITCNINFSDLAFHLIATIMMVFIIQVSLNIFRSDEVKPEVAKEAINNDKQKFNITDKRDKDERFGKTLSPTVTTYSD